MTCRGFTIYGERCSGTNHAAALLARNFPFWELPPSGWKHGWIQGDPADLPRDVLHILVVRNAVDWSRSLHLTPHHFAPHLRGISYSRFVRTEPECVFDHAWGLRWDHPLLGKPIPSEKHREGPFANIFALRTAKYEHWLRVWRRLPLAMVLRHEDLRDCPTEAIQAVAAKVNLAPRSKLLPVPEKKGDSTHGPYQPTPYFPLSLEDADHIAAACNPELEARCGYNLAADLQQHVEQSDAGGERSEVGTLVREVDRLRRMLRSQERLTEELHHYLCSLFQFCGQRDAVFSPRRIVQNLRLSQELKRRGLLDPPPPLHGRDDGENE